MKKKQICQMCFETEAMTGLYLCKECYEAMLNDSSEDLSDIELESEVDYEI